MHLRRAQVRFDEAREIRLSAHLLQQTVGVTSVAADANAPGPVPMFIVGMPRCDTTLLERMLGSHWQDPDAGELRDFNLSAQMGCDRIGGPQPDLELAHDAVAIDLGEVGRRYLSHTQWYAHGKAFYTDKLPASFIHVGHIARALPQARILHLVRGPMDTCFSNLKESCADAHRHSYDQGEMARHSCATAA